LQSVIGSSAVARKSGPRHSRSTLTILAVLLGQLCLAQPALGLASATDSMRTIAVAANSEDPPGLCHAAQVGCGVAGRFHTKFAVIRRGGPLVLVDAGGPGRTFESSVDGALLLAAPSNADILVIAEPWTSSPVSAGCLAALARALERSRNLTAQGAPCSGVPSWTRATYLSTVRDIEGQLKRRVSAVLAASFGAVATLGLVSSAKLPALYLSPALPPGSRLDEILRSKLLEGPWNRSADQSLRPLVQDTVLAAAMSSYSSASIREFRRLIKGWPYLAATRKAKVHRLALASTYRYGRDQVLPNLAGYLAGVCRSYEYLLPARRSPGLDAMYRAHPCGLFGRSRAAAATGQAVGPVCLVANDLDRVSPASWARRWIGLIGTANLVRIREDGHARIAPTIMRSLAAQVIDGRSCAQTRTSAAGMPLYGNGRKRK
jgi:pimeloyl-ACP methyl ester carboxylesterase